MDEQQIQETESLIKEKMERLKKYFRYYKEKGSQLQSLCMKSTNQLIERLDTSAQNKELQVPVKTVDHFITLLNYQLSLLGIHQQQETTISQYRWLSRWRGELTGQYEQLVSQKGMALAKKQQIKKFKYTQKHQRNTRRFFRIPQNTPQRKKIELFGNFSWKKSIQEVSKQEQETDQESTSKNQYQ